MCIVYTSVFSKSVSSFSDSSEDELAGKGVENIIDGQDSDNEVKSVSKRKQLEGGMERRTDVYNFDDEEPGDSPANKMKATAKHAQSGDEEKLGPESSAASKEHSNEQDQSDSEGHNLRKDVENSHVRLKKLNKRTSDPSDVGDAQISDDEPLVGVSGLAIEFLSFVCNSLSF